MSAAAPVPDLQPQFRAPETGVFLTPERVARETAAGHWTDRVLTDHLDAAVRSRPGALAIVDHRVDDGSQSHLTFGELHERAGRIAANLTRLGVGTGDVVSFQLPNWWEFIALHLACVRIGAVSNPLMPILRARELEFMVGLSGSRILVVPRRFHGFDHEGLGRHVKSRLPGLQHLLVVGGSGAESFDDALLRRPGNAVGDGGAVLAANGVVQLLYTSGTTGEPKGVMHTSNTLLNSAREVAKQFAMTEDDVLFMPAPFAHQIGFCYGMMLAIYLGAPLVAMDVWRPDTGADLMARHGATFTFASTPFLSDLVTLPTLNERDLDGLRWFVTSGAPVPPSLVVKARDRLRTSIVAGWGMTEVVLASADVAGASRTTISDGKPLPGVEVRVVGMQGTPRPCGAVGELQCRGSTTFVGYFKRPELYRVDAEGWFETGDLARIDEHGAVRIVGRSKDIIIRGGENVPVVEIENLAHEMPQVRDVALVGMPDPRLGERSCAFATVELGHALTLDEIVTFLDGKGIARQYFPERLEVIEEMPRTASGKIQKYVLRARARDFS